MPANLPLIGVEAVILGMAAFTAAANSYTSTLNNMARITRLTSRAATMDIFGGADAERKAAAVQKAQQNLAKVTANTAAATQRAAQVATNAVTKHVAAQQNQAQVVAEGALKIQTAQNRQIATANRLASALTLVQQAYTPARQNMANQAAITAANAQQNLARVTQKAALDTTKAQNEVANAATKAGAAQQTASAIAAQGAQRVSVASAEMEAAVGAAGISSTAILVALAAAFAAVALAAVTAFAQVISSSAQYQHSLAVLGAIAGETYADVQILSDAQLEISRNSTVSAQSLTSFSAELVKAGFNATTVTSNIGTLDQSVLSLGNAMIVASGGELEAARAASLLQVAFAGFGAVAARGQDDVAGLNTQLTITAQTVDAATVAVQKSTLTFTGFADAMKQGGGVAAEQGYSIQEFAAAVGVMGQTLTSGSEIGTGFRMMLQRLNAPSKAAADLMREYKISLYDAGGQTRQFRDVLSDLETAFSPLTEAERNHALAVLFGGRSIKTVSALLAGGTAAYDEMYGAVSRSGTALEAQNRILGTTASVMQTIGNAVEAVKLSFGEGLEPFVNSLAHSLKGLVDAILPTNDAARSMGEVFGGFLFNALSAFGEMWTFTFGLIGAAFEIIVAFNQLLIDLKNVIIQVGASGGQALLNFFQLCGQVFQGIANFVFDVADAFGVGMQAVMMTVAVVANGISGAMTAVAEALSGGFAEASGNAVEALNTNINGAGNAFNTFMQGVAGIPQSFASAMGQLGGIAGRAFQAVVNKVNEFLNSLAGLPLIGEMIGGARAAFSAASTAVGAAGVAITKFATTAVSAIKKIQLPNFRNYAAETVNAFKAARKEIDKNIGAGRMGGVEPAEYEPSGALPGGGGGGPKGGGGGGGGGGKGPADKAVENLHQAMEKAAELLKDFFDDIENANRDTAKSISDAYDKAAQDIADAVEQTQIDIEETVLKAQSEVDSLDTSRAIEADAKRRRDALDKELEYEQRARDQALEDEEVRYDRELQDLELVEDQKRKLREDTFDKVQQAAARARDEQREAEDRDFERSQDREQKSLETRQQLAEKALDKQHQIQENALDIQQKAIENALEREQKAREEALEADQQAREDALEARLDAEEAALEASQQLREDALKAELDAEKQAHDYQNALVDISEEGAAARAKAEEEFQKEIAIGVKRSIAEARRQEKLDAANAAEAEARANLDEKKKEDDEELSFERQQQQRLADLQAQFDAEDAAREASANEAKRQQQITFEAETLALRAQTEAQTLAMREEFARQELEMRERHENEVDALHAKHERERDDLSESLENARLERQKNRAREDREFAEQQEAAKQKFIEEENKKQLEATRKQEDANRERKRILEKSALEQREADEARRAALTEQLDQEEYERRIANINKERNDRIDALNATLEETQKKIQESLDKELAALREQLAEKIATIKERYIDRMEDLLREGGEAMKPIIDNIGEQMETAFNNANTSVEELIGSLQEALKAANDAANAIRNMPKAPAASSGGGGGGGGGGGSTIREGGKPGENAYEVGNYIRNTGGSEEDVRKAGGKKYGGFVPGPYGSPQAIIAHGGEYFEGIGAQGVAMAAVRAAESAGSQGIGSHAAVTNNYNYNVNANYGRMQTEGSVRLDLSALVAMTRR